MKFLIKLLCLPLPGRWRRVAREKLTSWVFSIPVRMRAAHVGRNFCALAVSKVSRRTYIGDEVCLKDLRVEGDGACRIGDHVHAGRELLILTANHNYQGDWLPYDRGFVPKDVEIGEGVWLGTRVTILPGAKIGEGSIIQAGAVVHGEIPPCSIAGGNPAVVFAHRDAAKYAELKARGAFRTAYGVCAPCAAQARQ